MSGNSSGHAPGEGGGGGPPVWSRPLPASNARPLPPPATTSNSAEAAARDVDLSSEVVLNLTTCSICLELFRDPKSLPCLHSFCRHCLVTLTELSGSQTPFPCPTCRRICAENISSLPDDFKTKLLVENLRSRQKDKRRQNNQTGTKASGSGTNGAGAGAQGASAPANYQPVLCQTHGNRRCEFFCNQCMIAVCVKCVSPGAEHSQHCYIDVFEDSQFLISEMEDAISTIAGDIRALEENDADVGIMQSEFQFQLDERARKLKQLVDLTKSQISAEYLQNILTKRTSIQKQIDYHKQFVGKTTEYLTKLKSSLKDCAVFDIYADAKMHLDSSVVTTPRAVFEKPQKFEFSPCIEYNVTSNLCQFFGQMVLQENALLNLQASSSSSSVAGPSSSGSSTPSTSGGARRKRQHHVASAQRKPSSVEALFSAASQGSEDVSLDSSESPLISSSSSSVSSSNDVLAPILFSALRQQENFTPMPTPPLMYLAKPSGAGSSNASEVSSSGENSLEQLFIGSSHTDHHQNPSPSSSSSSNNQIPLMQMQPEAQQLLQQIISTFQGVSSRPTNEAAPAPSQEEMPESSTGSGTEHFQPPPPVTSTNLRELFEIAINSAIANNPTSSGSAENVQPEPERPFSPLDSEEGPRNEETF